MGKLGPKSLCSPHLAEHNARTLRVYHERADAGACVECTMPAEPGMRRCAHHREHHAIYQVARRIEHNEAGWCVRCGYEEPAVEGHTLCARHIEDDRVSAELERQRGKTETERERRERYRLAGICPLCGDPPAPGGVTCVRHAEKRRVDSQIHRDRERGNG